MNQEILENNKNDLSPSSGLIRWVVIAVVMIIIFGGSFWYYQRYIKPQPQPAPSPSVTEAIWKTKSDKTVNDFISYWSETNQNTNPEAATKARDLLTTNFQNKLQTLKDKSGQALSQIKDQLNAILGLVQSDNQYQIASTNQIDDNTVEVLVKFNYNQEVPVGRIFILKNQDGLWLIDEIKETQITPVPSISPSPKTSSSSLLPSPSPRYSPSKTP